MCKAYEFNKDNEAITPSALFMTIIIKYLNGLKQEYQWQQNWRNSTRLNNKFSPKSNATRVEGAQMIFNLMKAEKYLLNKKKKTL